MFHAVPPKKAPVEHVFVNSTNTNSPKRPLFHVFHPKKMHHEKKNMTPKFLL